MIAQKFIASFGIFSHETGGLPVNDGGAVPHRASNSEVQRWCKAGNVHINGQPVEWDEEVWPIKSVVVFPRSLKHRVTLL